MAELPAFPTRSVRPRPGEYLGDHPPPPVVAAATDGAPLSPGRTTQGQVAEVQTDADVLFAASSQDRSLCGVTTLSHIIQPFVEDGAMDGAHLFVAPANEVVYERGHIGLRLDELAPGWARRSGTDSKAGEGKAAAGVPAGKDLLSVSQHLLIEIADNPYHLFTQPMRDSEPGSQWLLGMLIPESRFQAAVSELSFGAVSYLPVLLLLVLLATPILKVAAIGHRDRLTARDVRLLSASIVVAPASWPGSRSVSSPIRTWSASSAESWSASRSRSATALAPRSGTPARRRHPALVARAVRRLGGPALRGSAW